MAIDLETINETYYRGFAKWQPQGGVGDSFEGVCMSPLKSGPKRSSKAFGMTRKGRRSSWDEAGYPRGVDGIRFKTVLHHLQRLDVGYYEIAVEYWAQIGVDVEIQVHDNTALGGA